MNTKIRVAALAVAATSASSAPRGMANVNLNLKHCQRATDQQARQLSTITLGGRNLMNFTKKQVALAIGLAFSTVASSAMAADRYWVCSNGAWSDSACWSSSNGGPGGAGAPGAGDQGFNLASNSVYSYDSGYSLHYISQIKYNATSQPVANLTVSGGASFNPFANKTVNNDGKLIIENNATLQVTGTLTVGNNSGGWGLVEHFSGQSNVGNFVLASVSNSNGSYGLVNGSVSAGYETIGLSGWAKFTQYTGTTHSVSNHLWIGANAGSSGQYELNGALNSKDLAVGLAGTGTFTQNSGSNTISNLSIGAYSGAIGTYTQKGGTTSVANELVLGMSAGANGSYNLDGGTLTVGSIVGGAGSSAFNFNAGTINITGAGGLSVGSSPLGNSFNLGTGKALNVTNALTIDAGSIASVTGGALTAGSAINHGNLASNSSLNVGSGLVNMGTLGLSGGAVTGNINNAGTLVISNAVNHAGAITQTAGITTINGQLNTSSVDIQGGILNGSGSIVGSVLNSGGTMAVVNSPGSMTIDGFYTQSSTGIFDVELGGLVGGSQYDMLNVTGTASLAGIMNVTFWNGFTGHQGDSFTILSATNMVGDFDLMNLPTLSAGLGWHVYHLYNQDASGTDYLRLSVVAVPEPEAYAMMLAGLGLIGWRARRRG